MAILELPTRSDLPAYSYVIQLDGVNFGINITYNSRMEHYLIGLSDAFQNTLIAPVPLIVNWPLFDRFVEVRKPQGRLFAFDTSNSNLDPSLGELGARVRLFYEEANL